MQLEDLFNSDNDVIIRLKHGYHFYGIAKSDKGLPVKDIQIKMEKLNDDYEQVAVTDDSGKYKLNSALPGNYILIATGEADAFTDEHKRAVLGYSDQRVDFGPCDEYATWCGILFDDDGLKIPNSEINIELNKKSGSSFSFQRQVTTDNNGLFSFSKLHIGSYRIYVNINNMDIDVGIDMIIKDAGIINKDIHLEGEEVSGTVVDCRTNKSITTIKGFASCSRCGESFPLEHGS